MIINALFYSPRSWADREWVYACFDKMHLEPWQRLNHFRNGRELCRKDLMAKNIKRQRRTLEKENRYVYFLKGV
jgi:tubulin polyglutamylase TTLL9